MNPLPRPAGHGRRSTPHRRASHIRPSRSSDAVAEPSIKRTRPSGKRDLAIILIVMVVAVPLAWAVEEAAHSKGAAPWVVIAAGVLAFASRFIWVSPRNR